MSNTYFKIQTEDYLDGPQFPESGSVDLTAYMGGDRIAQLTVSRGGNEGGTSYVGLTYSQCVRLAGALLERAEGGISATGDQESKFTEDP